MSIVNRPQPKNSLRLPEGFVQRQPASSRYQAAGIERRQFPNAGTNLSREAQELALAVDIYKCNNGIQKINSEQLLEVIRSLSYAKV